MMMLYKVYIYASAACVVNVLMLSLVVPKCNVLRAKRVKR